MDELPIPQLSLLTLPTTVNDKFQTLAQVLSRMTRPCGAFPKQVSWIQNYFKEGPRSRGTRAIMTTYPKNKTSLRVFCIENGERSGVEASHSAPVSPWPLPTSPKTWCNPLTLYSLKAQLSLWNPLVLNVENKKNISWQRRMSRIFWWQVLTPPHFSFLTTVQVLGDWHHLFRTKFRSWLCVNQQKQIQGIQFPTSKSDTWRDFVSSDH